MLGAGLVTISTVKSRPVGTKHLRPNTPTSQTRSVFAVSAYIFSAMSGAPSVSADVGLPCQKAPSTANTTATSAVTSSSEPPPRDADARDGKPFAAPGLEDR